MHETVKTRAAIYNGAIENLTLTEIDLNVNENDILIKVKTSMFGKALYRALKYGHDKIKKGKVLGSLVCGEVANNTAFFKKGDRVVINPHKACGKCFDCLNGAEELCSNSIGVIPGGMSEYVIVCSENADSVYKISEKVPFDEGVLTEITACVLGSISKVKIQNDDRILIAGSGLTAFIHAQILMHMGYKNIDILYKDDLRKEIIKKIGAYPVNTADLKSFNDNIAAHGGYNIIFEVVGSQEVFLRSLELAAKNGKIVLFGGYTKGKSFAVDLNYLHYNGITLIGSYHFKDHFFNDAIELLEKRVINFDALKTKIISFDDLNNVVDIFEQKGFITLLVSF